ncbi:MAG: transglycosylase SLT domain-containing protein [Vicinamibacterales bacterium]
MWADTLLHPGSVGRTRATGAGLRAALGAVAVAVAVVTGMGAVTAADKWRELNDPGPLPALPASPIPAGIDATYFDLTPLSVIVPAGWEKIALPMTVDAFERSPALWTSLRIEDWDQLPPTVRGYGLRRMAEADARLLASPARWPAMTAEDWDPVPQPVRAAAYLQMVAEWYDHYGVGQAWDLSRDQVLPTMQAVMMAESWFEHRAVAAGEDNQDLGLAQCSDYCRDTLARLAKQGRVDFAIGDADHLNPWNSTRVLVTWFALMLDEARGDLDEAVRAYHAGISDARRNGARDYAETVERRRRYLEGETGSPTWAFVRAIAGMERGPKPVAEPGS